MSSRGFKPNKFEFEFVKKHKKASNRFPSESNIRIKQEDQTRRSNKKIKHEFANSSSLDDQGRIRNKFEGFGERLIEEQDGLKDAFCFEPIN